MKKDVVLNSLARHSVIRVSRLHSHTYVIGPILRRSYLSADYASGRSSATIDRDMGHSYPILLDVSQRTIVIVGGGRVAARKAAGVVDAGATLVTAISPQFVADFPYQVKKIERIYDASVLDGAGLVFAATNRPEVNDAVVRDAKARNILVNRADASEDSGGDFVTPAKYQDQNVMVTVSAASAALASSIRDALQRRWDPRWSKMAAAMQELRPWIKERSAVSQDQRAIIFRLLAGNDAMDVLDTGGIDALKNWLVEKHPELRNA